MPEIATPPKPGHAPKRTLGVNVRLRPNELAEAQRRAAGRSLAAIARAAWLGLPVPTGLLQQHRSTLTAYESAFLRIRASWGGLLDQCAAALNTLAKTATPATRGELMQIRLRLVALERRMAAEAAITQPEGPGPEDYQI